MILDFCAVCGTTEDLQQHHIEPVVLSGIARHKRKKYNVKVHLGNATAFDCFARLFDLGVVSDDESLTVCSYHHNILHGIMKFQKIEHNKLIKAGMKNAKRNGTKSGKPIGRPTKVNENTEDEIRQLVDSGMSKTKICKTLGIGVGTLYNIIEEHGFEA